MNPGSIPPLQITTIPEATPVHRSPPQDPPGTPTGDNAATGASTAPASPLSSRSGRHRANSFQKEWQRQARRLSGELRETVVSPINTAGGLVRSFSKKDKEEDRDPLKGMTASLRHALANIKTDAEDQEPVPDPAHVRAKRKDEEQGLKGFENVKVKQFDFEENFGAYQAALKTVAIRHRFEEMDQYIYRKLEFFAGVIRSLHDVPPQSETDEATLKEMRLMVESILIDIMKCHNRAYATNDYSTRLALLPSSKNEIRQRSLHAIRERLEEEGQGENIFRPFKKDYKKLAAKLGRADLFDQLSQAYKTLSETGMGIEASV